MIVGPRRRPARRVGLLPARPAQAGREGAADLANHKSPCSPSTRSSTTRRASSRATASTATTAGPGLRLITCGGNVPGRVDRLRRQHRGLRVAQASRLTFRTASAVAGGLHAAMRRRAGRASRPSADRACGGRAPATPGPCGDAGRRMQAPAELGWRPVALAVVAPRARGDHVVPGVPATPAARHHVVDGLGRPAAVGAPAAVTGEDRAPGQADVGAVGPGRSGSAAPRSGPAAPAGRCAGCPRRRRRTRPWRRGRGWWPVCTDTTHSGS